MKYSIPNKSSRLRPSLTIIAVTDCTNRYMIYNDYVHTITCCSTLKRTYYDI